MREDSSIRPRTRPGSTERLYGSRKAESPHECGACQLAADFLLWRFWFLPLGGFIERNGNIVFVAFRVPDCFAGHVSWIVVKFARLHFARPGLVGIFVVAHLILLEWLSTSGSWIDWFLSSKLHAREDAILRHHKEITLHQKTPKITATRNMNTSDRKAASRAAATG